MTCPTPLPLARVAVTKKDQTKASLPWASGDEWEMKIGMGVPVQGEVLTMEARTNRIDGSQTTPSRARRRVAVLDCHLPVYHLT
ncbi:hypothetical protein LshimejAT787_1200530 [Lyophyllum shimeji]|uniref:Uncharacterized protein n=1 Tax=Lyophyllum shimeji TaxID=47721 RepID=A0A9P3PW11_LYOSH|nr:hypothetical protein LshimejAT787_1200530 [Lyophyllum shimeji]